MGGFQVEKVSPTEVNVLYIDYGNRAVVPKTKVFILSSSSVAVPASLWDSNLLKIDPDLGSLPKGKTQTCDFMRILLANTYNWQYKIVAHSLNLRLHIDLVSFSKQKQPLKKSC